jgi:hypothetical protein
MIIEKQMSISALKEENSETEKTDFCLKRNSFTNAEWPILFDNTVEENTVLCNPLPKCENFIFISHKRKHLDEINYDC